MTWLIETKGLTRRFGGLTAVDGVDFTLPEGDIRALIGPNGAGKTTLVSLLCGRVAPSEGRMFFDGGDITDMPAHRRVDLGIAYTFQITSVFANLSVFDNVALAAQRHAGDALRRETTALLEKVGLAGHQNMLARELAYGHQRLLELAMGLALKPRLLILDEPTQGLSDGEIEGFVALVRDVAKDATVLLIEHNMDVVMQLAQTITVMDRGRIIAEGPPDAIRADAAVQAAYLGAPANG
ncbi:MAG TPA: ABC transporter ATP-binding protein [Rhizobiaceae bacterium]|nr:ABC transporter ATP-binding protein [Rhizobiaceae bacterium]